MAAEDFCKEFDTSILLNAFGIIKFVRSPDLTPFALHWRTFLPKLVVLHSTYPSVKLCLFFSLWNAVQSEKQSESCTPKPEARGGVDYPLKPADGGPTNHEVPNVIFSLTYSSCPPAMYADAKSAIPPRHGAKRHEALRIIARISISGTTSVLHRPLHMKDPRVALRSKRRAKCL